MLSTAAAFLATAAGKAVAASTIAAASVGGLAATDVIELPTSTSQAPTEVQTVDLPEEAEGNAADQSVEARENAGTQGEDNRVDPEDLPQEAQFGQCVAANAIAHGQAQRGEETTPEGAFDPTVGCDRPGSGDDQQIEAQGTEYDGAENATNADDRRPDAADADTHSADARATGDAAASDGPANAERADDAPGADEAGNGTDRVPSDRGPDARP